MDAIRFLRDEHKTLVGLLRQMEGLGGRERDFKTGVLDEIRMMFETHARVELEVFYPALLEAGVDGAIVDDSRKAIEEAGLHIQTVAGHDVFGEAFEDELRSLIDSAEDHFGQDELKLYPLAAACLGDALAPLGNRLEARTRELRRLERFREARPERAQNPSGGEQMRRPPREAYRKPA